MGLAAALAGRASRGQGPDSRPFLSLCRRSTVRFSSCTERVLAASSWVSRSMRTPKAASLWIWWRDGLRRARSGSGGGACWEKDFKQELWFDLLEAYVAVERENLSSAVAQIGTCLIEVIKCGL